MLKINTYRLLLSLEELWVIFSTSLSHVSILLAQNLMHLIQHFLKLKRNLCTSYKYLFSLSFNLKNLTKYNAKPLFTNNNNNNTHQFIPEIVENYKCTLLTFPVLFQFRKLAIILKLIISITPPFLIFP